MEEKKTVVVVQSRSKFGDGSLFWLFSKSQLEMVLREIEPVSVVSAAGSPYETTIAWQDTVLPVVNLDNYFGLTRAPLAPASRYIVLKGAIRESGETQLKMIVVPVFSGMKIGPLNFTGNPVMPEALTAHQTDILGAYKLKGGQNLVVVPDICEIASRCRIPSGSQERK